MKLEIKLLSKMYNVNIFIQMCNVKLTLNFETDHFYRVVSEL